MEQALLSFVEGIGNTDFSFIIVMIQVAFVGFWFVVLGWVWVDVSERTTNVFAKLASVFLVGVFNILGLVVYLLIRPKQTIQDLYWADLERRYLKYETAELGDCPNCKFSLQPGFNVCPRCSFQIKKQCGRCAVWVDKTFAYCPFCSSNIGDAVPEPVVQTPVAMEEHVNQSKEEAIKVVEGNQTKYVDRTVVPTKVKLDFMTFLKEVGDMVLGKNKPKKVAVKKELFKKKDKKKNKKK
jgi:RNA polymerase subunit RPABC4/transcription elongation factor Spt4